jgi:septal ring factor EnvC (AmiA/AmiB activator)
MIQQAGPVWRTVVGVRFGCAIVATLSLLFWGGCARVTPSPESTPTDLQVTADSLKTAVREAQRTASELRTELEEQRKELAEAQVARAQLQGILRETERRLADARQVIELQREELASAHTERERMAQTMAPLHSRLQQPPNGVRLQRKRASSSQDGAVPARTDTQEQSVVTPLENEERRLHNPHRPMARLHRSQTFLRLRRLWCRSRPPRSRSGRLSCRAGIRCGGLRVGTTSAWKR